jgi:hypothetical protein
MKNTLTPDTRVLQIGLIVLTVLFYLVTVQAQTPIPSPLPSPNPAPTPISKTGSILVNNPSTVGLISKWVTSSNNGTGTIGDSVIIESSFGTIGIGTNPFSNFKLGVDGGNTVSGGVYGLTSVFNGTGVRGRAAHPNSGTGVSGFGTIGVYGETVGNSSNGNNVGLYGFATTIGGVGVRGQ